MTGLRKHSKTRQRLTSSSRGWLLAVDLLVLLAPLPLAARGRARPRPVRELPVVALEALPRVEIAGGVAILAPPSCLALHVVLQLACDARPDVVVNRRRAVRLRRLPRVDLAARDVLPGRV